MEGGEDPSDSGGRGSPSSSGQKKKVRLHWDEENLRDNEKEAQKNPKMRIDEPKTPFNQGSLSDAGSSSNGSVPQSPELPTVKFVEEHRLAGFDQLEKSYTRAGSASESSTPRSREFEKKRKLHYKAEFHRLDKSLDEVSESDGEGVEDPLDANVDEYDFDEEVPLPSPQEEPQENGVSS